MQQYDRGGIWWKGAPHTAKERSQGSTCVSWGCPLPPYIKEQGGGRPALEGRAKGRGSPPPGGSRTPFPSPTRRGEGEGRRGRGRGKGGPRPPPSPVRTPHGGGHAPPPGAALS